MAVVSRETASVPPPVDDAGPQNFDESAEAAFLSEARERGEPVRGAAPTQAAAEIEETVSGPLPPLDSLVQKIPADVRATLEDLFRAKFVRVQRVPAKALKS